MQKIDPNKTRLWFFNPKDFEFEEPKWRPLDIEALLPYDSLDNEQVLPGSYYRYPFSDGSRNSLVVINTLHWHGATVSMDYQFIDNATGERINKFTATFRRHDVNGTWHRFNNTPIL